MESRDLRWPLPKNPYPDPYLKELAPILKRGYRLFFFIFVSLLILFRSSMISGHETQYFGLWGNLYCNTVRFKYYSFLW